MPNKVKYGLRNVYYAVATINDADHTATYGNPVALKGAVNLSLSQEGSIDPFYADDIQYFVSSSNNGYTGTLELALIPDSFLTDILGQVTDTKDVLVEKKDAPSVHFALMFEFQGDSKATKHVLYNCVASRPSVEGATLEDSIAPQTETLDLTCSSIYNATLQAEIVKAKAGENSDEATYAGWNTAVYQPA